MASFLTRPQDTWIRKAIFQIHLWTGIAAGLYAIFIGITGSLLVIHSELRESRIRVATPAATRLPVESILERASAAFPGQRIGTLLLPWDERDAYVGWAGPTQFAVDPSTGAMLPIEGAGGFWRTVERLHSNFTFARTGRLWIGIGGLVMVAMCLTGIVIWWPGRANWKRSIGVDWGAGWKRINWDLHSATGFWGFAFMLLLSITGAYFTWPAVFRNAVASVMPLARPSMQAPKSNPAPRAQPLDIATLAAIATREVPGRRPASVYLGETALTFNFPEDSPTNYRATSAILVDRYSGEILARDLYEMRSVGDQTVAWIAPLHVGSFADGSSWRLAVKTIYFLGGLVLPFLFVTGFIMWWNRVVSKRLGRTA